MNLWITAAACLFLILFGLASGRLEKTVFTPPMAFVGFGLVISPFLALHTDVRLSSELLKLLAEITLVLVLFTDASRIRFKSLRQQYKLPLRLLGIGLPMSVLTGFLAGWWLLPGLEAWEAAALAAILAPTDAALGQATIVNPAVPGRIRQTLNVESGLNDGLALPLVLITLSLASASQEPAGSTHWLLFAIKQVGLGPLAGAAVGWAGGWIIVRAVKSGWMSHVFRNLAALGLAGLAYCGAELIGGNGLISAFVCGLTLGNTAPDASRYLREFAESEGQLLVLVTFLAFGAVMVPLSMAYLSWRTLAYVVLSLTLVRMVPVWLCLMGTGLRPSTRLFVGWFGPRGLASILYALLMYDQFKIGGMAELFSLVIITVLVSVYAHGISAAPLAKAYGARVAASPRPPGREAPEEIVVVDPIPVRWPYQDQAHRRPHPEKAGPEH
ncbi:MAG: cation:proton antiporter [Desulfarculaceae bacterium]|nr:cation:proton antiporter [Desulfarculaceae bacterium]MCF8073880.1 cation:proton antiporter [Desulfarculaceae bacterium]MCF8102860.1 cation:proton antiporter [Desulfarculaceae bacterium]MCF8116304.1 cation:proton antiporter [Desulfarculaceae bacterium]